MQCTLTFQEHRAVPRGGLVSSEPRVVPVGEGPEGFSSKPPGAAFDRCQSEERRADTPGLCFDLAGPVVIHLIDFQD